MKSKSRKYPTQSFHVFSSAQDQGTYCKTLRDTQPHLTFQSFNTFGAIFSSWSLLLLRSEQVDNDVFTETTAPTAEEVLRITTPRLVLPQPCSSSPLVSSSAASSRRDNVSNATGPPHKLLCAQSTFPHYSTSRLYFNLKEVVKNKSKCCFNCKILIKLDHGFYTWFFFLTISSQWRGGEGDCPANWQ